MGSTHGSLPSLLAVSFVLRLGQWQGHAAPPGVPQSQGHHSVPGTALAPGDHVAADKSFSFSFSKDCIYF